MADIRLTKLRRLDMTTLLVFERLLAHRKASAVAAELGLTPPGVSHALKRLRDVFEDDLFLRRPHGLEPTAFALALAPRVQRAIEELRDGLSPPAAFDPSTAEALVRIGAFDYELATLLPRLVGVASRQAPGIRIVARAIGRDEALAALAASELDLAIGFFWRTPETTLLTELYREDYVAVARGRDAIARKPLTLARYCAAPHVLVSPSGELSGIVDDVLRQNGRSRRVIAATPLFLPALAMVRETGAIATVPSRLAKRFAGAFGLSILKLPFQVRPFQVSLARHRRNARSAMHDWLEQTLLGIAAA
jgi:DNA-binding transcriptional LysR family regulator